MTEGKHLGMNDKSTVEAMDPYFNEMAARTQEIAGKPLDLAEVQIRTEEIVDSILLDLIKNNKLTQMDRAQLESFLEAHGLKKEAVDDLLEKVKKVQAGLTTIEEVLEALRNILLEN
jgi:hypothetical protein